jgi:hypothetical protein
VADHLFHRDLGAGSLRSTVLQVLALAAHRRPWQLLWHVKEAARVWAALDLDSDRHSDCLGLVVGEITVFTSQVGLLTRGRRNSSPSRTPA